MFFFTFQLNFISASSRCAQSSIKKPNTMQNICFLPTRTSNEVFSLRAKSNWGNLDTGAVSLNMCCLLLCLYRVSDFSVFADFGVLVTVPLSRHTLTSIYLFVCTYMCVKHRTSFLKLALLLQPGLLVNVRPCLDIFIPNSVYSASERGEPL